MPEPTDSLNEVLGTMADRLGKYADIWKHAAKRNARGGYGATEVVDDLRKTVVLGVKDMADAGAAMLKALGAVAQQPADAPAEAGRARAKKKPAAKRPAKKAVAKKPVAKRKPTK